MRVIVDSNQIIQKDWFLSGPTFGELLRASERGNIELLIPQVVLDEVVNKYKELLYDIQRNLKKLRRDANNLRTSLGFEELEDSRIDEALQRYDAQLKETIARNRVKVIPYPVVAHELLVRRALERRRPFDARGHNGYRDTLVWISVLNAAQDGKLAFITDNWSDFAQSKEMNNKLADDLLADIKGAGYEDDQISLYPSVSDFVKSWIIPAVHVQQQLQDQLDEDEVLRHTLEEQLASVIEDRTDIAIDLDAEAEGEIIEILPEMVTAFHLLRIQDVRKFSDNEYLVAIYAEADVDLAITERKNTGSWRMDFDLLESRSTSKTIGFEFDVTYRGGSFADIQMTYPRSL